MYNYIFIIIIEDVAGNYAYADCYADCSVSRFGGERQRVNRKESGANAFFLCTFLSSLLPIY